MGKKGSEGKAYNNLAIAYYSLADYKKAIEFYQQSLSIAKEIGDKVSEGEHIATLAVPMFVSVIIKKQSNFTSRLLASQKRLETKV